MAKEDLHFGHRLATAFARRALGEMGEFRRLHSRAVGKRLNP
jgi:hypothetical protein